MKHITSEWLRAANDDLMVIEKILSEPHLTHIVAFHAQQAVEKTLKAIVEECEIEIPKIHKIGTLIRKIDDRYISKEAIDYKLIELLDDLYTESRYPGDFGLLPDGKPSLNDAKSFFNFARCLYREVSKKLAQ